MWNSSAMMRYVSLMSLFGVPSNPLSSAQSDPLFGAPSEPPTLGDKQAAETSLETSGRQGGKQSKTRFSKFQVGDTVADKVRSFLVGDKWETHGETRWKTQCDTQWETKWDTPGDKIPRFRELGTLRIHAKGRRNAIPHPASRDSNPTASCCWEFLCRHFWEKNTLICRRHLETIQKRTKTLLP